MIQLRVACLLFCPWIVGPLEGDGGAKVTGTRLTDTVHIIGHSGIEIGVPFVVKATRIDGTKKVEITSVNGVRLEKKLVFDTDWYDHSPATEGGLIWAWEGGALVDETTEPSLAGTFGIRKLSFQPILHLVREIEPNDPKPNHIHQNGAIRVGEIGGTDFITGELGARLGEWIVVKGIWKNRPDPKNPDHGWRFSLLSINGRPHRPEEQEKNNDRGLTLSDIRPVVGRERITPEDGQIWEMEAYESFAFEGQPVEVSNLTLIVPGAPRRFDRYLQLRWRAVRIIQDDANRQR